MARKKIQTRYNHKTYILDSETINKDSILPGHIINFSYDTEGKVNSDRRPLALVLFRDLPKKMIHAVNLKYLPEYDVQYLFEKIRSIVPLDQHDESGKTLTETTTRFKIGERDERIPTRIYESIIKPKFLSNDRRNCYRTYSLRKMSGISVVSYKIEREFRNWKGRNSENEN